MAHSIPQCLQWWNSDMPDIVYHDAKNILGLEYIESGKSLLQKASSKDFEIDHEKHMATFRHADKELQLEVVRDTAANRKLDGVQKYRSLHALPFLFKIDIDHPDFYRVPKIRTSKIIKAEANEKQYILGVVLRPDRPDMDGDIFPKEVIEKACFDYNLTQKTVKLEHSMYAKGLATVLESYIQRGDTTIGGETIVDGTWMMSHIVHSKELWGMIKAGKFTGFSIGGYGSRDHI